MTDNTKEFIWCVIGFVGFWSIVAGFNNSFGLTVALISGGALALLCAWVRICKDD